MSEEFEGMDIDISGLKLNLDNGIEIVDTGRPTTGSIANSDTNYSDEMMENFKNLQKAIFEDE